MQVSLTRRGMTSFDATRLSSKEEQLMLKAIADLDLSHNSIAFVKGMQCLGKLTELDLSHNCLESLDRLPLGLRKLNISHNNVSALTGMAALTQLQVLDCSYNTLGNLVGVPPSGSLRVITASHNKLSTCRGLEHCTSLVEVNVAANLIADAKELTFLRSVHSLRVLDIAENPLTHRSARVTQDLRAQLPRIEVIRTGAQAAAPSWTSPQRAASRSSSRGMHDSMSVPHAAAAAVAPLSRAGAPGPRRAHSVGTQPASVVVIPTSVRSSTHQVASNMMMSSASRATPRDHQRQQPLDESSATTASRAPPAHSASRLSTPDASMVAAINDDEGFLTATAARHHQNHSRAESANTGSSVHERQRPRPDAGDTPCHRCDDLKIELASVRGQLASESAARRRVEEELTTARLEIERLRKAGAAHHAAAAAALRPADQGRSDLTTAPQAGSRQLSLSAAVAAMAESRSRLASQRSTAAVASSGNGVVRSATIHGSSLAPSRGVSSSADRSSDFNVGAGAGPYDQYHRSTAAGGVALQATAERRRASSAESRPTSRNSIIAALPRVAPLPTLQRSQSADRPRSADTSIATSHKSVSFGPNQYFSPPSYR